MQFGHATSHRTGVPVLQNTPRAEHQVVVGIGLFNRFGKRTEEDLRAAGQGFGRLVGDAVEVTLRNGLHELAVELEVAVFHIRVVLGVEAIRRGLAVDNRPGETADLRIKIRIEVCQIVTVAERELTVFGKEGFFREPVQPQSLGRAALLARILRIGPRTLFGFRHAGKEHVKEGSVRIDAHFLGFAEHVRQCLLAAGDLLFAPTFGDFEALGKFEHRGNVAHCFTHGFDHLCPALRAALGVAVQTPLFEDHCGGKNQVGHLGRKGRVDVGDDDEVLGLAGGFEPVVGVRSRLEDVDHLRPQEVHGTVFETAQKPHDGLTEHRVERAFGNAPEFFGLLVVSRIADEHVGRQTVREGADFTSRTAGRGLTGE